MIWTLQTNPTKRKWKIRIFDRKYSIFELQKFNCNEWIKPATKKIRWRFYQIRGVTYLYISGK